METLLIYLGVGLVATLVGGLMATRRYTWPAAIVVLLLWPLVVGMAVYLTLEMLKRRFDG